MGSQFYENFYEWKNELSGKFTIKTIIRITKVSGFQRFAYSNGDDIFKHIPKETLTAEYGGNEPSVFELYGKKPHPAR